MKKIREKTVSIQDVQEVSNNIELQQICQSSKPSEMGIKKGCETEGDQVGTRCESKPKGIL